MVNLAEKLDEDLLSKLGKDLYRKFEEDLTSRKEWEQKHAGWKRLYYQTDRPVNQPWMGSAAESVPIMAEACNGFQARAYKAMFPSRNFVSAIPIGRVNPLTTERAERVARHMSFQLAILDKNYKRDKNAMLLAISLNGSDFTKAYYDPMKRRPVVERVRAIDLVVPYFVGKKRIEEIERKTHVIYMSTNEAKIRTNMKFFIEEPKEYSMQEENPIQIEEDRIQGLVRQRYETGYCKILEMHCLADLDDNGVSEPYIVWIDAQTQKVLRVQIRYEIDETGEPTDYKKPVEYFTHYYFLENPDGFYGLGYGLLIGDLNKAANKMLRMIEDAAELGNTSSGFISEQLDVKGGEIEMQLGKFIKVSSPTSDIQQGIYPLTFPGAHPSLVQAEQMIEGYARRLSSATDAVSGDVDKVVQPMTMMTMLEQSLQMPTAVMEQLSMALEDEFDKIYKLNRKYLGDYDYYVENDELIPVSAEDYSEDLRVIPIYDPRNMTRQQKISKNQAIFDAVVNNPILSQNPDNIMAVTKLVLTGMEVDNVDQYMQPPPPPPPPEEMPPNPDEVKAQNEQQKIAMDKSRIDAEIMLKTASGVHMNQISPESAIAILTQSLGLDPAQAGTIIGIPQESMNEQRGFGDMAPQPGNEADISALAQSLQGGAGLEGMSLPGGVELPQGDLLSAGLSPTDIGRGSGSLQDQVMPPAYFDPTLIQAAEGQ